MSPVWNQRLRVEATIWSALFVIAGEHHMRFARPHHDLAPRPRRKPGDRRRRTPRPPCRPEPCRCCRSCARRAAIRRPIRRSRSSRRARGRRARSGPASRSRVRSSSAADAEAHRVVPLRLAVAGCEDGEDGADEGASGRAEPPGIRKEGRRGEFRPERDRRADRQRGHHRIGLRIGMEQRQEHHGPVFGPEFQDPRRLASGRDIGRMRAEHALRKPGRPEV